MSTPKIPILCKNRKVGFLYHILESYEAGLSLLGTEAKSLRQGGIIIQDAYVKPGGGGLQIVDMHIPLYANGGPIQHEEKRPRQLLLRKKEIREILSSISQKGLTAVPVEVYFSPRGWAKIKIAVCQGKKHHDVREAVRRREDQRDMERAARRR